MAKNNPWIMGLTPFEAQRAVVNELGAHKVMVVLDNHVSLPKWCCGGEDGNGFFGDEYFDPDEWLQGLSRVAKLYKGIDTVSKFIDNFVSVMLLLSLLTNLLSFRSRTREHIYVKSLKRVPSDVCPKQTWDKCDSLRLLINSRLTCC